MPCLKDALNYLYRLQKGGIKPGLKRIRRLLTLLGNPHREYPSILVAGTNGKGSTASMVASMLTRSGYRTARYTSPHLFRLNERISIDGKDIQSRELTALIFELKEAVEAYMQQDRPTFFEFLTALAFKYFSLKKVELAVVEVGMGGRFDATNVVEPLVAVITNVGFDHTEYLGKTLKSIAREKAGVIKKGVKVVTALDEGEAKELIEDVARRKGATLYAYGKDFWVDRGGTGLVYRGRDTIGGIRPALDGMFQLKNIGCAIKVAELLGEMGYRVPEGAIREGIGRVDWPARFQLLKTVPPILLDCAHNPEGVEALRDSLKGMGFKKVVVVTGIMKDKEIDAIMGSLSKFASFMVCTKPAYWRSEEPERLKELAEGYALKSVAIRRVGQAVARAMKVAELEQAIVCVTGSIFTVAEAMRYLKKKGYALKR